MSETTRPHVSETLEVQDIRGRVENIYRQHAILPDGTACAHCAYRMLDDLKWLLEKPSPPPAVPALLPTTAKESRWLFKFWFPDGSTFGGECSTREEYDDIFVDCAKRYVDIRAQSLDATRAVTALREIASLDHVRDGERPPVVVALERWKRCTDIAKEALAQLTAVPTFPPQHDLPADAAKILRDHHWELIGEGPVVPTLPQEPLVARLYPAGSGNRVVVGGLCSTLDEAGELLDRVSAALRVAQLTAAPSALPPQENQEKP